MEVSLRVFLLVCIVVYFIVIAVMLKKRSLSLRYTLVWLLCGIGMIVFAAFPELVFETSALIGISNPVNAVFFLFAAFTVIILLSLTAAVSQLSDRNLRLIQSLALLEERVHKLENGEK